MEPCWGVSKAGQNACGNISATHTCSGLSKTDYSPEDWTFVARGTCHKIGGLTREQAAAKVKAMKAAEAAKPPAVKQAAPAGKPPSGRRLLQRHPPQSSKLQLLRPNRPTPQG
ncbi:BufA1 family periplasmic bufferin-type metallophore [Ideonella paludis]|uniref:BufA1 family periplasmic bufferin-type metallophore n=1 Tax=Ideonella paludis TaxID=1233411 RepID=UPI00362C458A